MYTKTNLYHVYHKMPALAKEDMYVELEELAIDFVNSGLLRIEAEPKQNFTRFSIPSRNLHINFSQREISDPKLRHRTYKILGKAIRESGFNGNLESKFDNELEKLNTQLNKHVPVDLEMEMQIARILVQSAHPIVFQMIILEEVEVFVSFGYNIGDVMDIASWKQSGSNSGMQSTDGKKVAVFVSCGGDPLMLDSSEEEKSKQNSQQQEKTHGDGLPALARMMGIAGQETGHYSDIIHNQFGQQVGRYSANFSGTRANPQVNLARLTDMKNIDTFWGLLCKIGIIQLIDREKSIQFYQRNPDKGLGYLFKILLFKIHRFIFILRARRINFTAVNQVLNKEYLAHSLQELLSDMAFNLEPKADVYSSEDKKIEEAIACIEALARVPQQANKWGHKNTSFFWRNLYKFYYEKVIPGDIAAYETITTKKFTLYPKKMRKYSFFEKLKFRFKK